MTINIGNTSNRTPVDNNRRVRSTAKADTTHSVTRNAPLHEDEAKTVNYRNQPGFIERRKYPDRRQQQSKQPLVDTRRSSDRRRSTRVDVEV